MKWIAILLTLLTGCTTAPTKTKPCRYEHAHHNMKHNGDRIVEHAVINALRN